MCNNRNPICMKHIEHNESSTNVVFFFQFAPKFEKKFHLAKHSPAPPFTSFLSTFDLRITFEAELFLLRHASAVAGGFRDNIDKRHLASSPVKSFTFVTKSILIIMIIFEKITIDTLAINIINITNNGTRCKQRAVVRPSTKASLMLFSASTGSPPSPSSSSPL